jgi:molybdopterin synthase catalytic subunit
MARVDGERALVRVTAEPLRVEEAVNFVSDRAAGATCVFSGTVRSFSDAGEVVGITYEAWNQLAERRIAEIVEELLDRWPTCRAAVLHRTGTLDVGETSVLVACSTPHRGEAFDACRYAIERLKYDVPIWKKEALVGGDARWVMGS